MRLESIELFKKAAGREDMIKAEEVRAPAPTSRHRVEPVSCRRSKYA
jgi:hypothetical protein